MKMTLKTAYVQGKTVAITGTISGVNGAWMIGLTFTLAAVGIEIFSK